ncbi:MAG: TRAP transporter small permease subunit [Granulosicoccus sp.]
MSLAIAVLSGLFHGFIDLLLLPWHIWQWLQLETLKERMSALTLAGQSLEFLYLILAAVLLLVIVGLFSRRFLRATVLGIEAMNRTIGHWASWVVLLLMFQQVLIIIMGQVFRGNELLFSPFGMQLTKEELQWLSGQLKFYNAILIAFASAYTFIEGGHVRVDLIYGNVSYRAQKWIDLLGSMFFMLPATVLLWWFSWPIAANSLFKQRPLNIFSEKASWRDFKFESSGTAEFSWVWAFKTLILFFAALLFLQAVAFMLRNIWALLERDRVIESHPREIAADTQPDINLDDPLASDTSLAPTARSIKGAVGMTTR